jgi:DUF438 domain-containing protein
MTPDEVEKYKRDITAVILRFCLDNNIDARDPGQVQNRSREIWTELHKAGVLHPEMKFTAFYEAITEQGMKAFTQSMFFEHHQPRTTKDVKCEVQ